ncbi:uncharacterized protein LOC129221881 [Uloborus diversus]|uniref:uncharacterized protein LOC129221881 n=1 Tax=Uloborus diversus TaxID=327109 RepID=UPI0024097855|nr:uncharacterized protein LOC129221881 [Uloborus diversus]
MKFLAVLLLIGFVAAASADDFTHFFTDSSDDVADKLQEMRKLQKGLSSVINEIRLRKTTKDELEAFLREKFDEALEKIEKAIIDGKEVNQDVLKALRDLKEKMKELNIEEDELAKETIEIIKERVKGQLKEILEKMGIFD